MNNSNFFANPLQMVHLISVFSSVNKLGEFFYDEKLLEFDDVNEPIPIINTLCDYLDKNDDNNGTIALGYKLLYDSDFYGSGNNETVHVEYMNALFDHIIASSVFARYVNTFEFLATLVNSTDNLHWSFIKKKIVRDLYNRRYLNQDGKTSKLSNSTIVRVTERLIFPLFPEPERDMRIIDADYIYAQAGLMLARIVRMNPNNISFEDYITMSQTIEQAVFDGKMQREALQIFQLPALLYYTKKNIFESRRLRTNITNPDFWEDAFNLLFSDLNAKFDEITKLQNEDSAYQFHKAFSEYKNRTKLAEDTLRNECPMDESDYKTEVDDYKFHNDGYHCKTEGGKLLPDINELFSTQNKHIANKYFLFEKALIGNAFGEDLKKLIAQPNVTVSSASVFVKLHRKAIIPFLKMELNGGIDLLRIRHDSECTYAVIRNESGMTLISSEIGLGSFFQKIGFANNNRLIIVSDTSFLKSSTETFDDFVTNSTRPRERMFFNMLETLGKDSTTKETVVQFLKNLIPFYPCAKAAQTGATVEIVFTCMLDFLSVIPVVGQVAGTGLKFANVAAKPLLLSLGTSMRTLVARQSIGAALKTGIRVLASEIGKESSRIFTKGLFKDLGISVLRSLDPGMELLFSLGKTGVYALKKCFSMVAKKIPSLSHVLKIIEDFKQTLHIKVSEFQNHDVFVDSFTGVDGYGPKYFLLGDQKVELRKIVGSESKQPVVLVNGDKRGTRLYQKIELQTGQPDGNDLIPRKDVLISKPLKFSKVIENIKKEGLSGLGILPDVRENAERTMLEAREKAVDDLKAYMGENEARKILEGYVLEDVGRTPSDLARHLINNEGRLPEWSEKLKLNDAKLYESLRFKIILEDLDLNEDVAVKRILDFYGESFTKEVILLDPKDVFHFYSQNNLQTIISFFDYYALENCMTTGFSRIHFESPEALSMRRAILSLIVRQIDESLELSPRKLYGVDIRKSNDIHLFKPGMKIFSGNTLNICSPVSYELFENVANKMDSQVIHKIFYEITLDSPYLAVDVHKILPSPEKYVVLLPKIEFTIEKVSFELLRGDIIFKVYLKNVPVSKSERLAHLTNSVGQLEGWGTQVQFDYAVDNFDLDLIN